MTFDGTITNFADARAEELCKVGLHVGFRHYGVDTRSGLLVHVAPTVFKSAGAVLTKEQIEKSKLTPLDRITVDLKNSHVHAPVVTSDRYLNYATFGLNELYSYSSLFSNSAVESLIAYSGELAESDRPALERHAGRAITISIRELSGYAIRGPYSVRLTLLLAGKPRGLPCLQWSERQEMKEFLRPALDDLWPSN